MIKRTKWSASLHPGRALSQTTTAHIPARAASTSKRPRKKSQCAKACSLHPSRGSWRNSGGSVSTETSLSTEMKGKCPTVGFVFAFTETGTKPVNPVRPGSWMHKWRFHGSQPPAACRDHESRRGSANWKNTRA